MTRWQMIIHDEQNEIVLFENILNSVDWVMIFFFHMPAPGHSIRQSTTTIAAV